MAMNNTDIVKTYENALPATLFERLKNTLMSDQTARWCISPTNHFEGRLNLVAMLREHDGSAFAELLVICAQLCAEVAGFPSESVKRVRAACILKDGDTSKINAKHTDDDENHFVGLLYLNDIDGDTIFWEGDTIAHREPPKANKLVVFNGRHYHSSSTPTKGVARFVLNMNFGV